MSDRNWDAELKQVDRAIEKAAGSPAPQAASRPSSADGPVRSPGVQAHKPTSAVGVFTRLGLAAALGIGVIFWPYSARCGAGLVAYLATIGVLLSAGTWSAIWTWRHRTGAGHVVALVIILWALILGALDILPRIGYAVATASHPNTWICM